MSSDDSLYAYADADWLTICGVSQAGYIRCLGDVIAAPVRSETHDYVQVAVGRQATCGRKGDGSVRCWFKNSDNQPAIPQFDPDGTPGNGDERPYTFKDIQAGQSHGCGLTDGRNGQTEGQLICWPLGSVSSGSNEEKLSTVPDGSSTLTKVPASHGGDVDFTALTFSQLSSTNQSNCALISSTGSNNGKPRCWSVWSTSNNVGVTEPDVPLSALARGGGVDTACGIVKEDTTSGNTSYTAGQVVCWGIDWSEMVSKAPTTGTYTAAAIGSFHACAVTSTNKISCWGKGRADSAPPDTNHGQMTVPAKLASATFAEVFAGQYFTCGLLDGQAGQTAGRLHCWGEQNTHPWGVTVPYEARPSIPSLAAGTGAISTWLTFTCGLTAAGNAACWGNAEYGWPPPTQVKEIAAGFTGACYIKKGGAADSKVFCVGSDGYGQTSGDGTYDDEVTADLDTLRFSGIAAGRSHRCGIIKDNDPSDGDDSGKARCWGYNDQGQSVAPGQTATKNQGSESKTITNLGTNTYTKIAAGYRFTCGLQTGGSITCWGVAPFGYTAHQIPANLQGKTFSDLDVGWWHQACAIEDGQNNQTAGKLHCWGSGYTTGGTTYPINSVPSNLQNLTYTKVSAGRNHNCAITTDGSVKCWGYNGQGRATVPTHYSNHRFADIAAGYYHTCAVTKQGMVGCWGADGDLDTSQIQVGRPSGLIVNFGQADPSLLSTSPLTLAGAGTKAARRVPAADDLRLSLCIKRLHQSLRVDWTVPNHMNIKTADLSLAAGSRRISVSRDAYPTRNIMKLKHMGHPVNATVVFFDEDANVVRTQTAELSKYRTFDCWHTY